MKKIILILLLNLLFVPHVFADKCIYKVDKCTITIYPNQNGNILSIKSGCATQFDLNAADSSFFTYDNTFYCPKLYRSPWSGYGSGIRLSSSTNYQYQHGAKPTTYSGTLIKETPTEPEPGNTTTPGKPNEKYEGVEDCGDLDVNRIKACGCIPAGVADITSRIYFILRIVGPLLLLILGGFEMAKAISTQDESAISKAKKKLVNKFIAAAAIFLTLTIIKFIVGIVADDATSLFNCVEILLNGYVI